MSPFELSSEHETFRKSVREFALGEIAPHAARWDKEHHGPTDVVRQMGDLGLMGLTAPNSSASSVMDHVDEVVSDGFIGLPFRYGSDLPCLR